MEEKNLEKFEEIFQEKPSIINSLRGDFNKTLLMETVWTKRFDIFVHLMKFAQDFSLVDKYGWNVLHRVSWFGTVDWLKLFSQKTIERLINRTDNVKRTPLHHAAYMNKHKVIEWLLAKGSDPNLENKDGQRPDEDIDCDDVTKEIFQSFRSSW